MHVGHIRSTGIGDALQRTLRVLGHRVISDNHIGDWGTQFGYIFVAWKFMAKNYQEALRKQLEENPIATMGHLYYFGQNGWPNSLKICLNADLPLIQTHRTTLVQNWSSFRLVTQKIFPSGRK